MKTNLAALLGVLSLSASPVLGQQFQYQPGALPGASRWTEGVELADVDGDGDLDIFFAEGDGFTSPGNKRQNILIINKLVETGPGIFADESVARLGVHLSNAKGVVAGDVDGDGYVDVLFCNGFNTDVPFLYMNRGAAQPGFFDLESATRGFTEALSSASAQFGDLDDDGDLDVIICDSGNSFLGGTGGVPRLFMNDGTGHFTENAAGMPAPTKRAHMDVQLIDIDNDWDLDFYGANRSTSAGGNHYLMLNDGSGNFTNASSLFPSMGDMTYEAEVGDLDGDGDIDMFALGLFNFQEGVVLNDMLPTGTLGFTAQPLLPGNVDDNEVGLMDFDNDGDLDVFIASLGSTERIYVNDGSGSMAVNSGLISHIGDSSLDLALGDLDGDGDYDLVTAQGESGSSQWANKLYLNMGSADNRAPVVVDMDVPGFTTVFPIVAHAKITDQVIDDGVTFVKGRAVSAAAGDTAEIIDHSGGSFSSDITIATGSSVIFSNQDPTFESATCTTAPYDFDLTLVPSGGSGTWWFITPGVYVVTSTGSGSSVTITVQGVTAEVPGTLSGGGVYRFELALPAPHVSTIVTEFFFEDAAGNVAISSGHHSGAPLVGQSYCQGGINSLGLRAEIFAVGSAVATDDNLELRAWKLPVGQWGLFFYGMNQLQVPFGQGFLCASGGIVRLSPPVMSDGAGTASRALSLSTQPALGDITAVVPIQVNFQFWYRDVGGVFNLTDGRSIDFQ